MDVISLISKEPGLPDYEPETTGYAAYNAGANGPRVHETADNFPDCYGFL